MLQAASSEFSKFAFIANTISFMSLQTCPVYACQAIILHHTPFPAIERKLQELQTVPCHNQNQYNYQCHPTEKLSLGLI